MENTKTFQPQRHAFADSLRSRIRLCGKTQRFIATAAGIDKATISRFMGDKSGLSMRAIEAILGALAAIEKELSNKD